MSRHVTDGGVLGLRRLFAGLVATGACGALLAAPAAADEGRVYEMVSPPAKYNGGVVFGQRASEDGNAVAFQMNAAAGPDSGAFGIAPYVARRTSDGWATRATMPPLRAVNRGTNSVQAMQVDFTDDFSEAWVLTNDKVDPADGEPAATGDDLEAGYDLYRINVADHAASWLTRPTPALAPDYLPGGTGWTWFGGRSPDGSRVVFISDGRLHPDAPVLPHNNGSVYEWVDGEIQLVGIDENDQPINGNTTLATVANSVAYVPSTTAVSSDASRVYWVAGGTPETGHLYLRDNGQTFALSKSRAAGNLGVKYVGRFLAASRDGGTAFFFSRARLLDSAPANGGIYRYDRSGDRLSFVVAAVVDGPALASDDATRLYFGATNSVIPGDPKWVDGERNLYLWEQDGPADPGTLTSVGAVSIDGLTDDPRLRVTPSGRYAAFTSMYSLDPRHRAGVSAIYRYDAETDLVTCVSCRPDGSVGEGDAAFRPDRSRYAVVASRTVVQPRNLTDDGRVYFQTDDPLVPGDVNGGTDVYEYAAGTITLISTGRGPGSDLVDNSTDGRSVFFTTPEALVYEDTDGGYPDVYVARVGGRPSVPPLLVPPCSGDSCQGTPTAPPTFPVPGSGAVEPDTEPDDPTPSEASFRLVRPRAAQLRTFARSGRVTVTVRVSAAGNVLADATARVGRRQRRIGRAWVRARSRGPVRITVPLTRSARRQLASTGTLRVTVTVTHSKSDESRQISMTIRRPDRAARARRAAKAER